MKEQKKQAQSLDRIAAALEDSSTVKLSRDTSRVDRAEKLPLMARFILWSGTSERSYRRSVAIRRSFPIRAYVGPNGGGKSLAGIVDLLPSLDAGRTVLSTVAILDGHGNLHPNYIPFTDFSQLLDAEHTDIFMDEIAGVANSREAGKMPAPVQNALLQQRRRDNTVIWTAPSWARADKILREVTQAVTECRGFYPGKPSPAADTGSGVRLWAPRRVFKFRTYDTVEFEDWTAGKRDKLEPITAQWFKGVGSRAFDYYDTMDAVSMVSGGDPDVCLHCGLKVRTQFCKGHAPVRDAFVNASPDLLMVNG